ncbi:hypothetical protein Tco_0208301, partial [Tanacetum coccineum]
SQGPKHADGGQSDESFHAGFSKPMSSVTPTSFGKFSMMNPSGEIDMWRKLCGLLTLMEKVMVLGFQHKQTLGDQNDLTTETDSDTPIVQSVDINVKPNSYAGAAGASNVNQPKDHANFHPMVAEKVFDGVNILIPTIISL